MEAVVKFMEAVTVEKDLLKKEIAELKKEGVDIPVVVGGIIPEEDRPVLLAAGVTVVYTPKDFRLSDIMRDIAEIAAANRK